MKILIATFAGVAVLHSFGVNVITVLARLGVGGIAVAPAAQRLGRSEAPSSGTQARGQPSGLGWEPRSAECAGPGSGVRRSRRSNPMRRSSKAPCPRDGVTMSGRSAHAWRAAATPYGETRDICEFAVEAFWPVTMYEADGFHMADPPNRFSVHGVDALTYNPDGSLDLYIQHESPGAARVRSI